MAIEKIKWADRTKVVATGSCGFFPKGHVREVHPKQAEALATAGKAEIYDEDTHGKLSADGQLKSADETTKKGKK